MSVGLLCFSSYFVRLSTFPVVYTMPSYPGAPAEKQWRLLEFWMQEAIFQSLIAHT